jgi:hypothetical protein
MSAWVVLLGLSAGYLINKNLTTQSAIATAMAEYNAGRTADDSGLAPSDIRTVHATVPDSVKYENINPDLPRKTRDALAENVEIMAEQERQYEMAQADAVHEIEGVYLDFRRSRF